MGFVGDLNLIPVAEQTVKSRWLNFFNFLDLFFTEVISGSRVYHPDSVCVTMSKPMYCHCRIAFSDLLLPAYHFVKEMST